ncbi:MAG: hypothetical protein RMJ56_08515 [Gemmataceae bacterium]|nr:hypothetical protein [Gemmata sp.]MDW8197628.1 hypothetical protein [Gemmataceae bacterium]
MLTEFCCSCGALAAALFVAAVLLRLAITFANLFVRPSQLKTAPGDNWGDLSQWNWDDWDDDDDEPEKLPPPPRQKAIPQPGIIKSLLMVFLMLIAGSISYACLGFFLGELLELRMRRFETRMLALALNLPFGFLLMCFVLSLLLPTTFWRAAWVAFMYHVILIGFSFLVGVIIFGLIALIA